MFYAAVNSYATETSVGFSNTWGAIGFATRAMRDAYVLRATDLATKAINADKLRNYGCKRGQVSYYDASGSLFTVDKNGPDIVAYRTGDAIDPVTAARVVSGEEKGTEAYWDAL